MPPEIDPSPVERAAHAAQTAMDAIDLAALLASPRALARATSLPTQQHLIAHFDGWLAAFSQGGWSAPNADLEGSRRAAADLRAACAIWVPGPVAPADVQQAARTFLVAIGVPEPPGGWDAFEAPSGG